MDVHLIYPRLTERFPAYAQYSEDDFYRALNKVEPTLIRTAADEVTYSLHVIIRFELDRLLPELCPGQYL